MYEVTAKKFDRDEFPRWIMIIIRPELDTVNIYKGNVVDLECALKEMFPKIHEVLSKEKGDWEHFVMAQDAEVVSDISVQFVAINPFGKETDQLVTSTVEL